MPMETVGLVSKAVGRGSCELDKGHLPHQFPAVPFSRTFLPSLNLGVCTSLHQAHFWKGSAYTGGTFKWCLSQCFSQFESSLN